MAAYDKAIAIDPACAPAHYNRGNLLLETGHVSESLAAYDTALRLTPDDAVAQSNRGNALMAAGRIDDAIAAFDTALRIRPDYLDAHANRIMALHANPEVDEQTILADALAFDRRIGQAPPGRVFANPADPARRLRIGYVSGDFRAHPVGYFMAQVLANRDRSATEVFCYSNALQTDAMTQRLQAVSDHWRSVTGVPDQAAADLITGDGIDILVDLSGHTGLNRLAMFALRPAPVQVTWLGFWGTTGLRAMDYILSDDVTIPPGHEKFYTEDVIRLPAGRFCYSPPDYAPPVAAEPPMRRLGHVTFGSFNNLIKVGPAVIRLWAAVLHAVPEARLVLKWQSLVDAGVRNRLISGFASAGIGSERLVLRGASSHPDMLAEYADIDIALDPPHCSGGLTSCEALWMGVPVVTMPGAGALSRQTLGFLRALGITDWVAQTPADYVRIAANLAADAAGLAASRASLRPLMAASPLCDGVGFAAGLDAAYRRIWQRWCETRAG